MAVKHLEKENNFKQMEEMQTSSAHLELALKPKLQTRQVGFVLRAPALLGLILQLIPF